MADDGIIIIVSTSDSSDVEIIADNQEGERLVVHNGAGARNRKLSTLRDQNQFNKFNSLQSFSLRNPHRKHTTHSKSDHVVTAEHPECYKKMTCETSHAPWQEKKKSHKSWSQVKNEREKHKHLPPTCKKARLELPQPMCSNNLCRAIHLDEDDASDDLPDLDQQRTTPEPAVPTSPITLSSEDDAAGLRLGIFASFNSAYEKTGLDGVKNSLSLNTNNGAKENRSNLLLTKSAKERMASIFNSVLRQKSVPEARPHSPSGFSDMSSSSSSRQSTTSRRHFMDAILPPADGRTCSSPVPSLPDDSVASNFSAEVINGNNEEHSDSETLENDPSDSAPVRVSVTTFLSAFNRKPEAPSPKKPVVKLFKEACLKLDIRKHFPIVTSQPWERLNHEGRASRRISYNSKFVGIGEDLALATAALTHMHVNTVDAVFEEGNTFLEYGLSLVSDFSSYRKPTEHIVKEVINKCLLGDSSMYVSYKSFKLLSYLWQKYPSCVHIDWEVFSQMLGDLSIEKGLQVVPSPSVVKGSLFLQIVVQALQANLYKKDLHNLADARKSLSYKLLSVDCAYPNLKQIVYWLGSVVTSEHTEVGNNGNLGLGNNVPPVMRRRGDKWCTFYAGHGSIPKVLPNLQKLLHLGIQVSRSCVDAAKRIAAELVQTYIYLPDIRRKKLLLQSMSSDLLRFKVSQKILENHCDGTSLCCEDFPVSLRQVVEAYYQASPPRSLVTPPQTPSDDENVGPATRSPPQPYSAASCEELAFLVYTNTQSYIRCAHDAEHEPLCQNGFQSRDYSFLSDKDLQRLRKSVDEFHHHLCQLTAELNSATRTYIFMMQCLGNLS